MPTTIASRVMDPEKFLSYRRNLPNMEMVKRRARDFQRTKCYRWENQYITIDNIQPQKDLELAFDFYCGIFNIDNADIWFEDRVYSYSYDDDFKRGEISLIPEHMKLTILLHEFSHLVTERLFHFKKHTIAHHGEEWLTLYMILLSDIGFEIDYLIKTAKIMDLRFYEETVRKTSAHDVFACP